VSEVQLAVEEREGRGKGAARKMRAAGRVPGVVYGGGRQAIAVSLDPGALDRIIHTHHAGVNALIDLEGGGAVAGRTVMVKELDRDPLRGRIRHVDLFEVDTDARIQVSVPVNLTGTPHGVTMGGLLDHQLHTLQIICKAGAIPDEFVIDVSHLDVGDSVHVHEVELPEGAEMQTNAELPIAAIVLPRALAADEEEDNEDEESMDDEEDEAPESAGMKDDAFGSAPGQRTTQEDTP